ncbi:MAG: hypothetical protein K6G52_06320 [Treponemataceae bacterium]|nr:hypothetical protein [Treponemataceae bacterium]
MKNAVFFILIAVLCFASCFAVVFPFWLFADRAPYAYTVSVLSLAAVLIVYAIVISFIKNLRGKTGEEKKTFWFNFIRTLSITILIICGILVPFVLVLNYYRIAALIIFVLLFVAAGVIGFCVKKR